MTDHDDREHEARLARARLAGLHGDGTTQGAAENALARHEALYDTTDDAEALAVRRFLRMLARAVVLLGAGYFAYGVLTSYFTR